MQTQLNQRWLNAVKAILGAALDARETLKERGLRWTEYGIVELNGQRSVGTTSAIIKLFKPGDVVIVQNHAQRQWFLSHAQTLIDGPNGSSIKMTAKDVITEDMVYAWMMGRSGVQTIWLDVARLSPESCAAIGLGFERDRIEGILFMAGGKHNILKEK